MKRTFLAAVLALSAAPCLGSSFEEGMRLMQEKKYPEAIAQLEKAARAQPGSPEVLLNLGWAYWHGKRIDDAWRLGQTLLQLDPENRVFQVFVANTAIERKDYKAAETLAEKVLKRFPEDRDATMTLARVRFLQGRRDEAVDLLDKLIARDPGDQAAVYRKAVFRAEAGRKQEALAQIDALLAQAPENFSYRRSRAKILSDLGRSDEAVEEWKNLTRRETDAQALMNLGWAYWKRKDYDAAWEIANTLVKLDDKNPAFLRFMANLEIERTNYAEAVLISRKALELSPGDRDAELTLSKALFRMQREDEAMGILQELVLRYPDHPAVLYRWAEFLGRTGRYDESLFYFEKLRKLDPANQSYRYQRAVTLYDAGRFDEAVAEWKVLAAGTPPNLDAVKRLRDDAFDRRDWDGAVSWHRRLLAAAPRDPLLWEKLSRIYSAKKDLPRALEAAQRAVTVDPMSINAYYMKSEILERMKQWKAAKASYEDVVRANPNSLRAFDGLSYVLEALGDYKGALRNLKKIEALTSQSVSPYLEIHKARLLADSGRLGAAHRVLKRIIADRRTVIPVLLYHGVSPYDRTDSIPAAQFRAQMIALKDKGYQSMTVSQLDDVLRGRASLPDKPILVTFDDGRTDSFENADPVLKEVGYRATMFVHVSKQRKPHFHASPADIARWQATGRWEMQAHGFQAHDPMPIDGFGRKGHFLPNRMWLAAHGRLETLEEYRARVADDYRKARQGVEDMLPDQKVVAFAYPYGDYGQNDYSNTPESAAINQALVKKNFHLAFVQEQYGINTVDSNPTDLRRFEVPRAMTADQLIDHLTLSVPRVQAQILDAQLWTRADQLGLAEAAYRELRAEGVDAPAVWAEEGVAYQKGGDLSYARRLFSRAAEMEPDPEGPQGERAKTLLAQSKRVAAPTVSAVGQGFSDSDTNRIHKELGRAAATAGPARLEAYGGVGEYWDRRAPGADLPRIRSREGGVAARVFAGRRLELDGSYARRSFWGGVESAYDVYTAGASLQIFAPLRASVRDGAANVETAAAIRAGRKSHGDGATLSWDPALNWKVSADYDRVRYNDSNLEQDERVRVTKRFRETFAVGAAYFHGDSTQARPEYFTPRGLNQYTGVVTFNHKFGELDARDGLPHLEAEVQYEGGYGVQPAGSRAVHSVRAIATARAFGRLYLTLDGEYSQSPTYISRRAEGALSLKL